MDRPKKESDSSNNETEESSEIQYSLNSNLNSNSDITDISASTSVLEYIYDEEILPEIEIREIVSIDDLIKENPRFVALPDEVIYLYINQFLEDNLKTNAKSKGVFNLYKNIISDNPSINILNYIYFVMNDIVRIDTSDINEYLDNVEKANNAPTYQLRQLELNKLAYPFELTDENDNKFKFDEPSNIILNESPFDISKTLINDTISLPVIGAYWKSLSYNKFTYIYENLHSPPFKYIKIDANNNYSIESLYKILKPKFKSIIENILSIDSLHTYETIFAKYGYDIYDLNEKQNLLLTNHIKTLKDEDNEEEAKSKINNKYPSIKSIYTVLSYLESIEKHSDLYNAYFKEDRLYRIQQILGSYIASLPNFQLEIELDDPYTLLTQAITGLRTFEDIKNIITQLNIRNNFNQANNLLKEISKSHTYYNIEQFKIFYNETIKSIIDDKNTTFITLYNDISEVVIGNDTSKYDGTPKIIPENVFEENQNYVFNDPIEEEIANPEEEVYDSIPETIIENFPAYYEVHEGIKEVLNYILPYLVKIRETSGLQWDINSWIKSYSVDKQRQTRKNKIKNILPDLNDFIIERICINSLEVSIERINQLNTVQTSEILSNAYPTIYKEWQDDCKEALFNSLTYLLLDTLESALNGTLEFSILNGVIEYADLWSPYGTPLTDKKTATSPLYYISAVATNILPYDKLTKEIIEEKILNHIHDKYILKLNKLKELWINAKYKKNKQDKATRTKEELTDITRRLLAKEKINFLPTYVKSYYYLPVFIPKKDMVAFRKQPVWAQGCCLSLLDKNYEADNDWKPHIKPLLSMKKNLAKDRWLIEPHKDLYILKPKKNKADKTDIKIEKQSNCYAIDEETDIEIQRQTVLDKTNFQPNDLWLERSQYITLRDDPRTNGMNLAMQCIRFAYKNDQANKIIDIIQSIGQINDIIHILNKIIQNINTRINNTKNNTNEYRVLNNTLQILYDMKNMLNIFLKATHSEYTICLFRAKYVLSRALCLPGIPERNKIVLPDNVSTNFNSNIMKDNYNSIMQWNKNNSKLNASEIQSYITKMREEQKKTTLNKLDTLSIDDVQLMKDLKRFGLTKVLGEDPTISQTNANVAGTGPIGEDIDTEELAPDIGNINPSEQADQEGEAEWLQQNTDSDIIDEDFLDSIL